MSLAELWRATAISQMSVENHRYINGRMYFGVLSCSIIAATDNIVAPKIKKKSILYFLVSYDHHFKSFILKGFYFSRVR